jgi:hypothetical protein
MASHAAASEDRSPYSNTICRVAQKSRCIASREVEPPHRRGPVAAGCHAKPYPGPPMPRSVKPSHQARRAERGRPRGGPLGGTGLSAAKTPGPAPSGLRRPAEAGERRGPRPQAEAANVGAQAGANSPPVIRRRRRGRARSRAGRRSTRHQGARRRSRAGARRASSPTPARRDGAPRAPRSRDQ